MSCDKDKNDEVKLNPLARAALKLDWESAFDHLGLPKCKGEVPLRIRIVRKAPPIENKPIQEQTENQENKK